MRQAIRIDKQINADGALVFDTVAHIENFREAVEDIVEVEFVGSQTRGKGTVFRETRQMGKRRATVEMEVVEYEPRHSLRIVSRPDQMGTVWDSRFSFHGEDGTTRLALEMTAESKNWFAGVMNRLFANMIRKTVDKDMDALKHFCEASQNAQ